MDFPIHFGHDQPVHILSVIFPVFAVAMLGYLLTWAGAFRVEDIPGLTRYVFNIALPVMLFDSMARVALPETVQWSFLLAYYLPTLLIYLVGTIIGRRAFRHTRPGSGVFAMGCAYSNTVLIGLPIITTAWGDAAILPLMMIVAVHAAVLFSLTTAVAESGGPRRGTGTGAGGASIATVVFRTTTGILGNPIVGGLAVGLLFNFFSIAIPETVATITGWIRASAVPAALFVTGASLRRYRVTGHLAETGMMIILKLVIHPALVWAAAAFVLRLPPLWTAVAVVTAALPTGINTSVFATKYDAAVAPVTSAILVTTALSVVTLTILLTMFGPSVG